MRDENSLKQIVKEIADMLDRYKVQVDEFNVIFATLQKANEPKERTSG